MPYGCEEPLSEMFSLSRVTGWEGWPRIHLCKYTALWRAEQGVGPFAGPCGFVFTNPPFPCRISGICNNKQKLLLFTFSFLKKKKKKEGRKSTKTGAQWGWGADKVDYEVFSSYLLGTRLSLVIKSVLLFYSFLLGLVRVEHYELIVFDKGDEGQNVAWS